MPIRVERGRRAYRKGLYSETVSAWYLRCKGYRILFRRYKTPVGEIDIIARRGATLVFVEVKARGQYRSAAEALTARTMSRMQRAADYFLASHGEGTSDSLRLDVMLISPERFLPTHMYGSAGMLDRPDGRIQ